MRSARSRPWLNPSRQHTSISSSPASTCRAGNRVLPLDRFAIPQFVPVCGLFPRSVQTAPSFLDDRFPDGSLALWSSEAAYLAHRSDQAFERLDVVMIAFSDNKLSLPRVTLIDSQT